MLKLLDGDYPDDIEETFYERFEKHFAIEKMKESSWNKERNQILVDEEERLVYTFNPDDALLDDYPTFEVIVLDEV